MTSIEEMMIGSMTAQKALRLLEGKAPLDVDDMLEMVAMMQRELMEERDVERELSMSRREAMAREWMTEEHRAENARRFMVSFITMPDIANGHSIPKDEAYTLAAAAAYGQLDLIVSILVSELIAMAEAGE